MGGRDCQSDETGVRLSILCGEYGEGESNRVDGLCHEERGRTEADRADGAEGKYREERYFEERAGTGRERAAGCVGAKGLRLCGVFPIL